MLSGYDWLAIATWYGLLIYTGASEPFDRICCAKITEMKDCRWSMW